VIGTDGLRVVRSRLKADDLGTETKEGFMPGAHEKLEHAEHAAHSAGHHSGNNKLFGVTMALIGVLIAFCAAMVGSERNELTKTMIKQTQAHSDFTAASTKYRLVLIELEKQHARVATARDTPGGWSPTQRFVELASDYGAEKGLSKNWADSYEPLVEAHFDAAEGYEQAQLIAEIGIVLASLGVLLASRAAWMLSVLLSAVCVLQVGRTFLPTRHVVNETDEKIVQAEKAYSALRKAHEGTQEDEKAIEQFDPDRKIRTAREARITLSRTEPTPHKE
jgi:hypothetical protein